MGKTFLLLHGFRESLDIGETLQQLSQRSDFASGTHTRKSVFVRRICSVFRWNTLRVVSWKIAVADKRNTDNHSISGK